ncbi:MAG: glycosyltransferase family 39 protein [Candidatus Levybacteria bacterium]|nr:glycosyltransferase family 39 protein [Candidatus Levybacteria bacterium]
MKKIKINRKLLFLIVFSKIFIFTTIFIAFFYLPFNKEGFFGNFHYPIDEKISLVSSFKTWDSQHYLYLSEKGYSQSIASNRFFPLYPFSIKLVSLVVGNKVFAGLLASFIFSILGLVFFYRFCKKYFKNENTAFRAILLLLSFPTAFYISLIYSEGACFFLTMGFFYFLYKKDFLKASIFAFFLPLVRPVGIFIVIPHAVFWISYLYKKEKRFSVDFIKKVVFNKETYLVLSSFLGLGLYFLIMQLTTQSYLSGISALQESVVGNWQIANIFNPVFFFVNLFFPDSPTLHGFTNSIIDRGVFMGFLFSLYLIYKKLDKTLFSYALMLGMVPVFGNFMSYTRYVLLVFPIFMVFVLYFEKPRLKLLFYPTVIFLIIVQAVFLIMHSLNYWVS